ncbi:MAG: type II toxin-antitoxin system VapC family toxin [Gammaproteobacteria bacterium]
MLLLDTQVLLWWLADDPGLSREVREKISETPSVFVSLASCWEIALKTSIGKLEFPLDRLEHEIAANHFAPLPISIAHILESAALPPFHRDPFDRMLIAQARTEGLVLVTGDQILARYEVQVLAA